MSEPKPVAVLSYLDVQGHRGCRGLMPENTIPAFLKALELGVTTLEMDLVITKDLQVLVSHEPFFNHEIATTPDGQPIEEATEKQHNIFELDYNQVKKYDVGLATHPRFPEQTKMQAQKPLLVDLAKAVKEKCDALGIPVPFYNVEIKRHPKFDNVYHPDGEMFSHLVVEAINMAEIKDRTFIQSFDPESLEAVRRIDPTIPLVYLVTEKQTDITVNLNKLTFIPQIYSPDYRLVDDQLVIYCHNANMKVVPWTVNDQADMNALIDMNVDGIITDYPDVLLEVVESLPHVGTMIYSKPLEMR